MSIKYRADIDGLRAFAVISVIIFHLNPKWLPNGYIGVDIFFVLSGFLITRIIYQEMAEKQFSIIKFYSRRIKRILPAFFTVLFSALFFGYWLFESQDIKGLYNSALSSVLFMGNIYFARSTDYFDTSSDEKPLLHFWSLSVEEQFYFIFPLFLLFLFKFPKLLRWKWGILSSFLGILLLSVFIPLSWQQYYLSHFRFIEMLSGAMLAIFVYENRVRYSPQWSFGGSLLSLSILTYLIFSEYLPPPPQYFSIFLFGIALLVVVLISCNSQPHLISKFFSITPLVWIGKLSYSLYLWHWVVLSFARYIYQSSDLPINWIFVCLAIIVLLSILSYFLIENPLRRAKIDFKWILFFYFIIPSSIVLLIRFFIPIQIVGPSFKDSYEKQICYQTVEKECRLGGYSNNSNALFIGDSHSLHLLGMAEVISKNKKMNIHLSAANGCPLVLNYNFVDPGNSNNTLFCKERNMIFDIEKLKGYSHIIISNFWANRYYVKDVEFYKKFNLMLEQLVKLNKPIYIINSSGYTSYNIKRMSHLRSLGIQFFPQPQSLFSKETDVRVGKIKSIVEKYPEIMWIDLRPFLSTIISDYSDIDVFFDDNHLTFDASKALGELFIQRYPEVFGKY